MSRAQTSAKEADPAKMLLLEPLSHSGENNPVLRSMAWLHNGKILFKNSCIRIQIQMTFKI